MLTLGKYYLSALEMILSVWKCHKITSLSRIRTHTDILGFLNLKNNWFYWGS